jgi:GT2 family glycosyltransferase
MYFSVIIAARNAGQTIGETILAVLSQSVPRDHYEVLVVDDGSIDQTTAVARKCGARVVVQPPIGLAAARNTGARAARGDLCVFLDPYSIPKLDWLAQMVAPFNDPSVAGVQGAYRTNQAGLFARLVQSELDETYRRLAGQPSLTVIAGMPAAYRRRDFLAAGGFDPSFAAAEDLELSCRLSAGGRRLVFAPKACADHYHHPTLRGYLEQRTREGLWRSLVNARFPGQLGGEDLPSPVLRTQIPLVGLTLGTLVLGTRWPRLWRWSGLCLAAFASTTVPGAWRARDAGGDVALASPGLGLARALAFALGIGTGSLTVFGQALWQRLSRFSQTRGH